jgi:hypothetical protein
MISTPASLTRAVEQHLGIAPQVVTPALEEGTEIHNRIEAHYKEFGVFPDYLHQYLTKTLQIQINEPILEKRKYFLLAEVGEDSLYLSGQLDCYIHPFVIDWKTTNTDRVANPTKISSYLSSDQLTAYSLFYPEAEKGLYVQVDGFKEVIINHGVKTFTPKQREGVRLKMIRNAILLYSEVKKREGRD